MTVIINSQFLVEDPIDSEIGSQHMKLMSSQEDSVHIDHNPILRMNSKVSMDSMLIEEESKGLEATENDTTNVEMIRGECPL